VCIETLRDAELVVDLDGWLTTSSNVGLVPVGPRRLVDTRIGLGGSSRLGAGATLEVQAVDPSSTATAVSLEVTAVDPGGDGYVTVWPCGTARPVVANLDPRAGITRPNAVNVRVGAGGKVCIYTLLPTDVVVDVFGEYRAGATARYGVVAPSRVLDTRAGFTGRFAGDGSWMVPFGEIVAAQVNVTAVAGDSGGYVTAYQCATGPRPFVANVTYDPGSVSGNAGLASVGRGYGCFYTHSAADLVVDLFGVWTTAR
jgi:hypothetical protein